MQSYNKSIYIMFYLLLVINLVACSSSKPSGPTEINPKNNEEFESSEYQLFSEGRKYFEQSLYSVAKEKFASLASNYPLGPYSEFANLMVADCDFIMKNYVEAAASYQNFVKSFPQSSSRPYAILQIALGFQLANRGVGRDNSILVLSEKAYEKLFQQHPNSLYALTGKKAYSKLLEQRAQHEAFIVDFYKERGYQAAYEARKAEFDQKWSDYASSQE